MKPSDAVWLVGTLMLGVSMWLSHREKRAERATAWDSAIATETGRVDASAKD